LGKSFVTVRTTHEYKRATELLRVTCQRVPRQYPCVCFSLILLILSVLGRNEIQNAIPSAFEFVLSVCYEYTFYIVVTTQYGFGFIHYSRVQRSPAFTLLQHTILDKATNNNNILQITGNTKYKISVFGKLAADQKKCLDPSPSPLFLTPRLISLQMADTIPTTYANSKLTHDGFSLWKRFLAHCSRRLFRYVLATKL
jgi:hypothetical protein